MMQAAVPSFNVNDQPINDASTLVRPANLRGLAPDHTLILVNGKRRHRSAVITFLGGQISDGAQGPDISVIPSVALKQVEVLRDGAAAQYGSDAIAGVINFALKDDAEGGLVEFNKGQYYEGDGATTMVAGNVGLPLTDQGFVNLSLEYRTADPTSRSVQRDDAAALINNGNTFVEDPAQVWGSPEIKGDLKFFANAGLELDQNSEAYLFGNYARREVEGGFYFRNPHNRGGVNDGGTNDSGEQLLLVADLTPDLSGNCPTDIAVGSNVLENPVYINQVANNPDCFAFNELFPGGFTPKFGGIVTDASLVVGTRGELDNELNYDVSGAYGTNEIDYAISNTINPSLGPDTPTSFNPGRYIQTEASFNIDINKYIDIGGNEPLFLAGGIEYRYEAFEAIAGDPKSYEVGPLAAQGFGIGSNGFPGLAARFQGKNSRNSAALYIDSEYFFSDDFMVGAAIRYEDFSDFGDTTKGKLSARYQLNETVAIRGAIATGFKAPTIGQSNVRNVTTAFSATGLVDEVEDRISTTSGITLTQADINALLAQGVTDASSFSEVSFFTNDFTTSTQGIDVVANYSMEMLGGDTVFSFAGNWTDTEVDDVKTFDVNGEQVQNISPTRIRMIEDNLPEYRFSLTGNHTNGDWRILTRLNYFSDIFEDHIDAGLPIEEVGAEYTVDFEVGYHINESFIMTLGARNAFDNLPDENVLYDTEVAGSKYPTTSPIGINGGFYYLKGVYTF